MHIKSASIALTEDIVRAQQNDPRSFVQRYNKEYRAHLVLANIEQGPDFRYFQPGAVYTGQPIITFTWPINSTPNHILIEENLQEMYDDYVNGYANL